jgi:YD repeat-containing protein
MRMLLILILLALAFATGSAHATLDGAKAAAREWCIQDQNFGTCEGPVGATPTSLIGVRLDDVCSKFAAAWAGYPWFNYDGTHANAPIPSGQCVWNNPFNGEPPPFYWAEDAKQIFKCQLPGFQGWQAGEPEVQQCPDPPFDPNKNAGPCCHELSGASNPINGGTGNKNEVQTDFQGTGSLALQFMRYYNSAPTISRQGLSTWTHNYQRLVQAPIGSAGMVRALRPDGRRETFVPLAGGLVPDGDNAAQLTQTTDGQGTFTGWKYVGTDDTVELYDTHGVLLSIASRAGIMDVMSYSTSATPPAVAPRLGLLIGVVDSFGRQLTYTYDSLSRLATATDVDGRVYRYAYDSNNNLTIVTYPDGRTRQYLYNEPAYSAAQSLTSVLTGIVDENGTRFAAFSYDAQGRAIASEHSGGASRTTFAYSDSPQQTVITDALGTSRTFSLTTILGVVKNTGSTLPCSYCGITSSSVTYDANGNVGSRTDFNNKKVCYAYDLSRNLETARLEGALSSEDCSTVLASPPNRPDVRKITTVWNANYRLPATLVEPAPGGSKTTTFIYDATGNLTQKSTVAPKNDGTSNTITRTWNWTYATLGRVLTATDPDNHTTTTTYYTDNDADLGKRGNVQTVTNAAGHITQITAYDANSRPLSITDPNGLVTTLAYHPRGWLTSRQVGAELTSYTYDGVGQLTKVTLADGSYLQYTYDAAHRLTQINDSLNNKIAYTLDAMGNRIQEQAFDPSNTLARTKQQVFDSLNRLHQSLGAL